MPAEGEWTVLAAWPTVVTLDAGAGDEVVQAVWNALSTPRASIESVVSSIPIRTAAAEASFSVVRFRAEGAEHDSVDPARPPSAWTATVVARGAAAVDLHSVGGTRRFGSGGMQPWALAEFSSVVAIATGGLAPVPESVLHLPTDARRLDHGIARASRVLWATSVELFVPEGAATGPDPDTADGETVLRPRMQTAPTAAPLVPAAEAAGAGPDGAEALDAASGGESDAGPDPAPEFELRVGDGEPIALTGAVVIGRSPRIRRSSSAAEQLLVTVDSPSQKVSANHVEIARTGRTVVVTDLRSTNGTTVRLPGQPALRLRQGDSVVASVSAIVEIGDGNVIHISSRDRGNSGITL